MPQLMDFCPLTAARKCQSKLLKANGIARQEFEEEYTLYLQKQIQVEYNRGEDAGQWRSMRECAGCFELSSGILERILNCGPGNPSGRKLPPITTMEGVARKLGVMPAPPGQLDQVKTDWKRQFLQPLLLTCLAENSPDLGVDFHPLIENRRLVHELDLRVAQIGTLDATCVGKRLTLGELLDLVSPGRAASAGLIEIGACLWLVLREHFSGVVDRLLLDADSTLRRDQSEEFRKQALELRVFARRFREAHRRNRSGSKQLNLAPKQHWIAVGQEVSTRVPYFKEPRGEAAILMRLAAHDLDPPDLNHYTLVQLLQRSSLTSPLTQQLFRRTPALCPL